MAKKKQSDVSKAARELSKRGAAKGGRERASRLSPQERSDIARRAAAARWNKGLEESELPKALCGGQEPLRIGDTEIPCYVLEDERRVINVGGVQRSLQMSASGGAPRLASFARQIADNPSMANDLSLRLESPIEFVLPKGGVGKGYEATLLADMCDAILEARKHGRLTDRYQPIADAAEILVRGFAVVGIIALIDEATGYQTVRRRLELAEILDRYLDDNLNQWTKTFPDEFYEHFFRLKGWDYVNLKAGDIKPGEVGRFTRDEVYRRLHPGIVEELEERNPFIVQGRRLHKHHQWLTLEIGHPALETHIAQVVTVMRLSNNWLHFEANLQKALPMPLSDTGFFPFIGDDSE